MRSRTTEPAGSPKYKDQVWSPAANPAVRDILDHLADELAREYIRLLKQAAASRPARDPPTNITQANDESRNLRTIQFREPAPRKHRRSGVVVQEVGGAARIHG